MFDTVIIVTLVLSVAFPGAPWLFGALWGRRGVYIGTALAIVLLCLFTPIFSAACSAENCGQGAIALLFLWPVWILSGVFTILSALLARVKCAR